MHSIPVLQTITPSSLASPFCIPLSIKPIFYMNMNEYGMSE